MSVADGPESARFTLPQAVCRDFERGSRLEWLDTNHTGAYVMGTAAGVNTRRYHALLIASLNPPVDRYSILPRVEEHVTSGGERFELATVQYPGAVQPRGFEALEEFRLAPFPLWRYRCGSAVVEKSVCLLDGQQAVLVWYEATVACRLEARLFLAFRDYHSLVHQNDAFHGDQAEAPGSVTFAPYPDLPALTVLHNGRFQSDGLWYRNHEYLRELERGLDYREDLFSPGSLVFEVTPQRRAWLIATLEPQRFASPVSETDIQSIITTEAKRRQFLAPTQLQSALIRALDQFRIIRANGQRSLIAGYPWFTDWSRDTLISLPALRIAGFPQCETKEILEMLVRERSQGLIPNRFSDRHGAPEYNAADATLWWFVAAQDFIERTKDLAFLRNVFYPAAMDIVNWHRRGTQFGIRVDPLDHLLCAGTSETQLTWMDARVGGSPVTARAGKPIEINALWYNALCILARWSEMLGYGEEQAAAHAEAKEVLAGFRDAFWNAERGCLYDVVTPSWRDASVRPNQLLAISLPYPLIDRERARMVVQIVQKLLLTPAGLRTLEPRDPHYQPRFEGNLADRDRAYHQGTVWPWLIGPFIAAYLYAYGNSAASIALCRDVMRPLENELQACCLGSLSEVYDAESPQRPGGCPAQLWSVAQLIAALERLGRWE